MIINTQQGAKLLTHLVPCDVESVPTKASEELSPIESLDNALKQLIAFLQKLFDQRPVWTRRGLRNHLTSNEEKYILRIAIPYVAYIFRSGPWRDAIVKFGYDPRTDPEARIYQTLMFRIPPDPELEALKDSTPQQAHSAPIDLFTPQPPDNTFIAPRSGRTYTFPRRSHVLGDIVAGQTSHIFTGQPPLARDGKTWMICDIHDPTITARLIPSSTADPDSVPPPQPTCDIYTSGWYGNVTLATARAIMRAKIQHLHEHRAAYPNDEDFAPLLELPAHITNDEDIARLVTVDARSAAGSKCVQLAGEIRGILRNAPARKIAMRREAEGTGDGETREVKRVRWQDEGEEEEEGEEGEEAEEVEGLEDEEEEEEEGGDGQEEEEGTNED